MISNDTVAERVDANRSESYALELSTEDSEAITKGGKTYAEFDSLPVSDTVSERKRLSENEWCRVRLPARVSKPLEIFGLTMKAQSLRRL